MFHSFCPAFQAARYTRMMPKDSDYLLPFLFLSPDFLPKQRYLGVKGQSLGISGVHHRGIRLKDDALSRGLQSCPTHGHQQIHHLRGKETKRAEAKGSPLELGVTQYPAFRRLSELLSFFLKANMLMVSSLENTGCL